MNNSTNKAVWIKTDEKALKAGRASWAEQMLLDKFEAYGLSVMNFEAGFKVVKETEKAYCLLVPVWNIYYMYTDKEYTNKDWEVWMPKSACSEFNGITD